ncbi:hypothetical protein ACFE04_029258 [Oxalis oulophora]
MSRFHEPRSRAFWLSSFARVAKYDIYVSPIIGTVACSSSRLFSDRGFSFAGSLSQIRTCYFLPRYRDSCMRSQCSSVQESIIVGWSNRATTTMVRTNRVLSPSP